MCRILRGAKGEKTVWGKDPKELHHQGKETVFNDVQNPGHNIPRDRGFPRRRAEQKKEVENRKEVTMEQNTHEGGREKSRE